MVEFISYKKEKLPISISFYALEQLEKEGLSLNGGGLKPFERMFWHALVAGHFHENMELTIKSEHAGLVLDDCFLEFKEKMALFLNRLNKEKPTKRPKK